MDGISYDPIGKVEVGDQATLLKSNSSTQIYEVTSGRTFKPEAVIITNISAAARVQIYDCQSGTSTRRIHVIVAATDTTVLNKEDLVGIRDFHSGVVAYTSISGTWIHVGGKER